MTRKEKDILTSVVNREMREYRKAMQTDDEECIQACWQRFCAVSELADELNINGKAD